MTPYEIMLLLEIYTSGKPSRECPILSDTLKWFVNEDLIAEEHISVSDGVVRHFRTTRRGREMIRNLSALPLPLYNGEEQ